MRRLACLLIALLLLCATAWAETAAEDERAALHPADIAALEEFAGEYAGGLDFSGILKAAEAGEADFSALLSWLKGQAAAPIEGVLRQGMGMLAPVLLLALMGCMDGGRSGARFLLRMRLLAVMLSVGRSVLAGTEECLETLVRFSDAAAPAMAALTAASGMEASAAILSPAAAIAANLAQDVFLDWGIPVCGLALCVSAAGSMSEAFDLSRGFRLLKRLSGWGTGLCFTLFTAMLALQGNVAAAADGVGLRTAKFAVDSASPVIGSGVSEVWDSYIAGVFAARSALGFSGVALLLAAGFPPLLHAASAMLMLHITSVVLDVQGDKCAARAAEQAGDVCRMALQLSCGAMAMGMILLGAGMSAGRGMLV